VIKRKKPFYKRVWFWLFVVVVLVVVIVIVAVAGAANDAVNKSHTVTYKVTGTVKKADIEYWSNDGSGKSVDETAGGQSVPWTKTVTVKGDLSAFVLSATPSDIEDTGTLSCELDVDGKTVSTGKSTVAPAMVSCSGSGYDGK